jgi:hypothetical protein
MATATNVTTGKPKIGGAIFCAPLGSTLPTSTSAELDAAFRSLGYCSEDGLTNDNGPETSKIKAWGGDNVLVLQTDRPDNFGFTLIEALNVDVLKAVYGDDNVTEDANGNIEVKATGEELPELCWVVDMIMRGNRAKRIVIPCGQISALGTINYKDNDAVGYQLTISDTPDEQGVYHYEYISGASA